MANRITLLRIVLLFVGIGFIYTDTVAGELIAFGIILVVILLDGLDGVIARREGRADETGAVMDIVGDRVVENALWIVFAHIGLVPVWVPLVVVVRGLATDAVRSIARLHGETAMRSVIGRWVVASRASRAIYAVSKFVAFGYLILYLALIRAQAQGLELGEMEGWLPQAYVIGLGLVYFTVAFCLVRGVPVLVEGRRYVQRK
jgi:CDP-diacylglycerol--glycerol-3-phosphate 3-phosphatidyltransferase